MKNKKMFVLICCTLLAMSLFSGCCQGMENGNAKETQATEGRACYHCGGSGVIVKPSVGEVACGICSGTGQQYYPDVYYDPAMNMWIGQYMACSGCGGSGYVQEAAQYVACEVCKGSGVIN